MPAKELEPGFIGPVTAGNFKQKNENEFGWVVDDLLDAFSTAREMEIVVSRGMGTASSIRRLIEKIEQLRDALVPGTVKGTTKTPSFADESRQVIRVADEHLATLRSLLGSVEAGEGLAVEVGTRDPETIRSQVADRHPKSYCDLHPADGANCVLEPERRASVRLSVHRKIDTIREVWSLAIAAVHVEEKLREEDLGTAGIIAKALLGVFASVLGSAVGAGVAHHVMKSIAKGVTEGVGKVVDEATQGGVTNLWSATMSVDTVPMPKEREAVIAMMKAQPLAWSNDLHERVGLLLDAELNAADEALDPRKVTQALFEARLRTLVAKHGETLKRVGHNYHPALVMGPFGTRMAMITPEMVNHELPLSREFKNGTPVRTGKFKFLHWIDKDIEALAWDRATVKREAPIARPSELIASSEDAAFWAAESLPAVRLGVAVIAPAGLEQP